MRRNAPRRARIIITIIIGSIACGLLGAAPASAGDGTTDGFDASEARGKVLLLLDISGSMRIGERERAAKAQLTALIDALPSRARFDIVVFDHRSASLFGGGWMRASDRAKKKARDALAKVSVDPAGYTNLAQVLIEALTRRPDEIVLITDGGPTAGDTRVEAILAGVGKARERLRRRPPIHVHAITDGSHPSPEAEDEWLNAQFLRELARKSDGRFRGADDHDPLAKPLLPEDPKPRATREAGRIDPEVGEPTIRVLDAKRREVNGKLMGTGAVFHVQVDDPALGAGPFAIHELAAPIRLKVVSTTRGGVEIDDARVLALSRQGNISAVTGAPTQLAEPKVGCGSLQLNGSTKTSSAQIAVVPGGFVKLVYERDGREWEREIEMAGLSRIGSAQGIPTAPPDASRERAIEPVRPEEPEPEPEPEPDT